MARRALLWWSFACVGAVSFMDRVGSPAIVAGNSMAPALMHKDILWEQTVPYNLNLPNSVQVGDIICFSSPLHFPKRRVTKRVTALEGHAVEWKGKQFFIPPGRIWVEGDNASDSTDSRVYGPIPLGMVEGKITRRLFPNATLF